MGVAWLIYLIWLWVTFKEPSHEPVENENHANNHQPNDEVNDALEQGLKQPLLITSDDKGYEAADQDYDDSEEASQESCLPATSIWSAYRLLMPSVKICAQLTVSRRVQLLIYFMLKYVMDILLWESSVITTYYFNWSTSRVALFLACLGLTVLPVNVVGSYISNMFEDRCQLVTAFASYVL
ncbi:SPX domain-containing membrane protein At4g22990-like isoform X2 [Arachis stenosperma]|uniref:SPX domain-containing membrane protein At4g22990-like isoform X2 n=1 Tax=Arachis stenosperma TaxID=217475 RepID=UPI0025AC5105|nr:SPX domain-containing membrane protein At4g22990-like isoform X2 [Arachis stenosperma]